VFIFVVWSSGGTRPAVHLKQCASPSCLAMPVHQQHLGCFAVRLLQAARSGSETWQSEEQTMPCDAKRCTETQTRQAARKPKLPCDASPTPTPGLFRRTANPTGQGGSETWQSEEQDLGSGARHALRQDGRAESHHLKNSFFSSLSNFTPASAATNISAPVFVLYQS
jgi:hypothetical protein